jgi:glycosyltransferase involved in cell wall biosynthesis
LLISVVTPTLNAIRYLRNCIESIRIQASSNVQVEHIVVDGGSSDGTVELARSAGCTVMTGKDEGIFDAINKGSFNSNGVLIGFLGADDILLPGTLDAVYRHFRSHDRRWFAGGGRWLDADGRRCGDITAPPAWITVPMLASLGWNCISHMATYVHRELFDELGGFDTRFRYFGDYEFMLRALEREPFCRVNRTLFGGHRHGTNASMQQTPIHWAETKTIMERYAPSSSWKRAVHRYRLKVWLNATSPTWFVHKRIEQLRDRSVPATLNEDASRTAVPRYPRRDDQEAR